MEKLYPVNTYLMRMSCDKCGGNMEFTGTTHPTNPPQFLHMCDKCKDTKLYSKQYPGITYEPIEQTTVSAEDTIPMDIIDMTMNTSDIEEIMGETDKIE